MAIANVVAMRSTCDRARVGAVIALEGHIIATGYNGSVRGLEHCDEVGHKMVDGHCVRTVHAEQNAIIQCALHNSSPQGAHLYTTHFPCIICTKLLLNAGITKVFYGTAYGTDEITLCVQLLTKANVGITQIGAKP